MLVLRGIAPALALALAATSCPACDCGGRADGARCATRTPTLDEPVTVGGVTLRPSGRRLAIVGLAERSRWSVARGPALSLEPVAPAMDAIEAQDADVVLLLGGFGSGPRLEELVAALAELEVPVLLVPGPRDRLAELDEALSTRRAPHVVSLAGFQIVEAGPVELIIAPGGLDPRYLPDPAGCALSEGELAAALAASHRDRARLVVGFEAPSGTPLTAGLEGAEAGSDLVRRLLDEAQVYGGIFAGPDGRVGVPYDDVTPSAGPSPRLRLLAPPLLGPALEGPDGTRSMAGPALVLLGPDGLAVPATHP